MLAFGINLNISGDHFFFGINLKSFCRYKQTRVMLHSRIAEENGEFTVEDVIGVLCRKMIRRHPHVFGDEACQTPEESLELWNEIKRQEKEARKNGIRL